MLSYSKKFENLIDECVKNELEKTLKDFTDNLKEKRKTEIIQTNSDLRKKVEELRIAQKDIRNLMI